MVGCVTVLLHRTSVSAQWGSLEQIANRVSINRHFYTLEQVLDALYISRYTCCFYVCAPDVIAEAEISPFIISPPLPVYEELLSAVNLLCVASGNPEPAIQWWFNGIQREGAVSASLVIPELKVEDRGNYSCTATASYASGGSEVVQSDSVVVNIQGEHCVAQGIIYP